MENLKLISCFNGLLLNYMNQGERGQASSFNAIKIGLEMIVNMSAKNGPIEEMSMVYGIMPEIISLINEKSDDFSTDITMIHKAQENFEKRFEESLNSAPLKEDTAEFFAFIKTKKAALKRDIELRKNMTQIIHDQKENF